MKKLLYSIVVVGILAFFAVPSWAHKGGQSRGASGGKAMYASAATHSGASMGSASRPSNSAQRSAKGGALRGPEF